MKSKPASRSDASSSEEFERDFVRARPGRVLVVGSQVYREKEDRRLRYPDVLGVDMLAGPGVDRVLDLEEALPDDLGTFAHVECMSVLEHSRRPWLMAANLTILLEPGGTLFVAVPFVWRVHGYPSDYWRFTAEGVRELFPGITFSALRMGSSSLHKDEKLPARKMGRTPWFPRTETFAFGTLQNERSVTLQNPASVNR